MKNKKQFTLIELIIVIIVIGILAAMALPKLNGVVRNAKLSAMINDKETLEKTLILYYQKNDELPLLNENEQLIIANEGISLSKIVLAEEVKSSDMDTIYKSLKETLTYYSDSEDSLYRIDLSKIKDNLSKDIKYGHKKNDKDFYVYSTKTENVYYYDYLINGNGTIQHNEYDTLLKDNELITKTISPSLSGKETIINNKPIIELTTNLEDITTDTIIDWTYTFIDEDKEPSKISFILNDIEYDDFTKIPTKLDKGDYNLKFKMQDSKGLWSDEIIKTFIVEQKITIKNSIALGKSYSLKIGQDGNIYGWGKNDLGQLGIGNVTEQKIPQKVTLPNGEKPLSIFSGSSYSIAITDKGSLYGWGYNSHGQLGIGNTETQKTPKKINIPNGEKPISVYIGESNTMIITDKENLYGWGSNSNGELGLGDTRSRLTPTKLTIPNGETPIDIALGDKHSVAITNKGNIYVWGDNYYNQLGIPNVSQKLSPTLLTLPVDEKPISVFSKRNHSLVITDKGNVYGWGYKDAGQLGIGYTTSKITPQIMVLPIGEKAISIATGVDYSMILTNKGDLYVTGGNGSGQLGLGANYDTKTPIKVSFFNGEKIVSIFTGEVHSMAITEKGEIYAWGSSYNYELGSNFYGVKSSPIKIELP